MVKAPANSLSPDNSKKYHYKVTPENASRGQNLSGSGGGLPYHSQFHFQSNPNKNTSNKKSVSRRVQMAEPPGSVSNAGPTLLVTTVTPISVTASPQSGTPMIAVVAPTARNTNNNNNNNNNKSAHLKGNHSPIKATTSANLVQQQQQQPQRLHPFPQIFHTLPVQIPANLLASAQTQATNVWPTAIVEPAFHFGPGFERAASTSIMEIPQNPQRPMTCPTHGSQNTQLSSGNAGSQEHVVFFHVSPGVSVTFQIGNSREVVRGK